MEVVMLHGARVLTPDATNEFRRGYTVYRCALNALADLAASKKRATYHVRPKMHQLSHLVWNHLPRNPRYCGDALHLGTYKFRITELIGP